jgi:Flp pilus assembly protein TadG
MAASRRLGGRHEGPRGLSAARPSPRWTARASREAEAQSGQAIVEAALVLPSMFFLILCAFQLTLLQHARIMVEWAAYSAARTGIVYNMDNGASNGTADGRMRQAAVLAILPTYGRTDSPTWIGTTLAKFALDDLRMQAAMLPMVQVVVENPHKADFNTLGTHLNKQEIDFDDIRPAAQAANLLSIQVRYLFELRVPFANWMIQTIWFASQLGTLASWGGFDMTTPTIGGVTVGQGAVNAVRATQNMMLGRGFIPDGTPLGLNMSGLAGLARMNKFYVPVNAWFTMRMQSNPYVQWAAP